MREMEMKRIQIFLARGDSFYMDCTEIKLTPDTMIVKKLDNDGNLELVGEFYRTSIAGWRLA